MMINITKNKKERGTMIFSFFHSYGKSNFKPFGFFNLNSPNSENKEFFKNTIFSYSTESKEFPISFLSGESCLRQFSTELKGGLKKQR